MKRTEVEKNRVWKLDDIFSDIGAFEKEYSSIAEEYVEIESFKGRLGEKCELRKCLDLYFSLSARMERVYCYTMFLKDQDVSNNEATALNSRAESLFVKISSVSSYIVPELSGLEVSVLDEFIADEDFSDVDYMLSEIKKSKAHILSGKEERILALGGDVFSAFSDIFGVIDNVELPFGNVTLDGKTEKLTHGKYAKCLQSQDEATRKAGFDTMYKAVKSLINTISTVYAASVKKDNYLATVKNFSSAKEMSLFNDDVPTIVYDTLIKSVDKNLFAVHRYIALRKKIMEKELHMFDLYVPMVEDAELSLDFDEAFALVLKGLKPLGEEYSTLLETAYKNRWMDVEETENKRSGAYSCGVSGVHPFVLLNHSKTTHDVFTIAHELGHAMHSYYSTKTQPFAKADYSIFVAEVASTVNEVLLVKYLLGLKQDLKMRKFLLSYYLDTIRTTLFRQTMFSEFEEKTHEMEGSGTPLTENVLSEMYYNLNKKYYGDSVVHDEDIRFEWARIPHFYRPFYVYKYSTGIIAAINIVKMIENGETEKYFEFLKAGGKKSPYEILKDVGVDLANENAFNVAFNEFSSVLNQLEDCYK